MKTTLVGYTGFVGSNLASSHRFDYLYNSKNINSGFGQEHDYLVYSGVRAEKYLANMHPESDRATINNAIDNIVRLAPKKLILISTVDIYKNPNEVNEKSQIDTEGLLPYGMNRYYLEQWVKENIKDYHIIRLPGLFGQNIKKNFIFDIITVIPSMLRQNKFDEIIKRFAKLNEFYDREDEFYKLKQLDNFGRRELKDFFENDEFNATSFTDSRNYYQFYNLQNLWKDINIVINKGIRIQNISTEPINAGELYKYITGNTFVNYCGNNVVSYDMKSLFAEDFGGSNGYLYDKNYIMLEIKNFIRGFSNENGGI